MAGRIDIPALLSGHSPKTFAASLPAFEYDSSTPAHRFTGVIASIDRGKRYAAVLARDFFDPALARALLAFADASKKKWTVRDDVRLLEGFAQPGYGFDSVLVLGPKVHELFSLDSAALNARSVLVVPIFRPEFVGDESVERVQVIRRSYVSTLDWKRAPCPRVYLRFADTAADYRSKGRKRGLEKPETAKAIIAGLTDAKGSFAELENYLGERRRLTVQAGKYVVTTLAGEPELWVSRKQIARWLDEFLMKPPRQRS